MLRNHLSNFISHQQPGRSAGNSSALASTAHPPQPTAALTISKSGRYTSNLALHLFCIHYIQLQQRAAAQLQARPCMHAAVILWQQTHHDLCVRNGDSASSAPMTGSMGNHLIHQLSAGVGHHFFHGSLKELLSSPLPGFSSLSASFPSFPSAGAAATSSSCFCRAAAAASSTACAC